MTGVHRSYPMPFGARFLDDGRVNIRLWAPGAKNVDLCLQGNAPEARLQMAAEADGWYGITTDHAGSGYYYQFRINGKDYVPDPVSRYQPQGPNGSSQMINPADWEWPDSGWQGRPWEEAVFYELHVGTFSKEGTFHGLKKRLDYLADLGVTAIQLMPIAAFSGQRNWGYDGVLPFAPHSGYGTPDDLKDLIATAHAKGLMIFNDVVYNHFGPEGNYLHWYAPDFFTPRFHTGWGDAINFAESRWVRQYFIHNALYWLEEYQFDGLRLDAVHAIHDDQSPDILEELAEAVRQGPGYDRHVYLVLENDNNAARYLRRDPSHPRRYFDAQWNDDLHHGLHLLMTGETYDYYEDYRNRPVQHLGRCLTEGFAYQGERSACRGGRPRGEPSADLPPAAFVSFLQNHDMVGNRPLGERITDLCNAEAVRAATAIILLAPSPPLLFMGEEWACSRRFTYFVDVPEPLGEQIAEGRRQEFARIPELSDDRLLRGIGLPNEFSTFEAARLAWDELGLPPHREWLEFHRELLRIRRVEIVPRLRGIAGGQAHYRVLTERAIQVCWRLNDGSTLNLASNLGGEPAVVDCGCSGRVLYATAAGVETELKQGRLPPWSTLVCLEEPV